MRIKAKNYAKRNFRKVRDNDKLSEMERSERMSGIRSKNTKLENEFVSKLRTATKKKFYINDRSVLGNPDIVFRRQNVCIFLDSDFWHGWQYPRWKHLLKDEFWRAKIERNRKRDERVTRTLKRNGWVVLRFWEHNLKKESQLCVKRVVKSVEII